MSIDPEARLPMTHHPACNDRCEGDSHWLDGLPEAADAQLAAPEEHDESECTPGCDPDAGMHIACPKAPK